MYYNNHMPKRLSSERRERLLLDVVLGRETPNLTSEERAVRERLAAEVEDIRRHGGVVEVPAELPDVGPEEEE